MLSLPLQSSTPNPVIQIINIITKGAFYSCSRGGSSFSAMLPVVLLRDQDKIRQEDLVGQSCAGLEAATGVAEVRPKRKESLIGAGTQADQITATPTRRR